MIPETSEVFETSEVSCAINNKSSLFLHTMTDPVTFREAQRTDLTAIIRMLANDVLGQQREYFSEPLSEAYVSAFEEIQADAYQELIVAERAEEVIGTMQLSFLRYLSYQGGLRAQVENVHVRDDCQGQGIGEAMLRWAIARAQERGAHLLQLTTDKQRPAALRFYQKLGFVASHEGMKLHFTV